MAALKAYISGVAGLALSDAEKALFRVAPPAGLIIFARNCDSRAQISALVADFKSAVGTDDVLILVDQEGGRVQRLRPPLASLLPPAAAFLAEAGGDTQRARGLAYISARLTAAELKSVGIDTDCAPVLDVPVAGAHDIIGNRAYARDPATVIEIAAGFAEGLMAGGVLPVIKHIPGHGRAAADSHLELPVVATPRADLELTDFVPFRALRHLPAAMTAHVLYAAIDAHAPASTSPLVTEMIIRGHIGFDGLLMSDDLGMKALTGDFGARAQAVLAAGSDLALHCSSNLAEIEAVASAVPVLSGRGEARFAAALAVARRSPTRFDLDAARDSVAAMVARGA